MGRENLPALWDIISFTGKCLKIMQNFIENMGVRSPHAQNHNLKTRTAEGKYPG